MQSIPNGFLSGVNFVMGGAKLRELALKRKQGLEEMIAVREGRIAKIREEYKITDKDIIELLQEKARRENGRYNNGPIGAASYMLGSADDSEDDEPAPMPRAIPAGVVALMDTENDNISQEKAAVKRLRTITDNMDPDGKFPVTLSDLEFLGL